MSCGPGQRFPQSDQYLKHVMRSRNLLLKWHGIVVIGVTLALFWNVAEAQQANRIPRIGYLSQASPESDKDRFAAFQQGLRELGYIEGKNIVIEQRYAGGQF